MTREELAASLASVLRGNRPVIVVLAGSNSAGKTTFYDLYLKSLGLTFVNADHIAQVLRPTDPAAVAYEAAATAKTVRRGLVAQQHSFCMETVFSDPAGDKLHFLRDAQHAGYVLVLLFFRLSDPMLSSARVLQRVARGGHDVPDDKIVSRFERTRSNAAVALGFVDVGWVIDNSSAQAPYRLVERWERGLCIEHEAAPPGNTRSLG